MKDVFWILVTIAFFALLIGYVRFCDRYGKEQSP